MFIGLFLAALLVVALVGLMLSGYSLSERRLSDKEETSVTGALFVVRFSASKLEINELAHMDDEQYACAVARCGAKARDGGHPLGVWYQRSDDASLQRICHARRAGRPNAPATEKAPSR